MEPRSLDADGVNPDMPIMQWPPCCTGYTWFTEPNRVCLPCWAYRPSRTHVSLELATQRGTLRESIMDSVLAESHLRQRCVFDAGG
jgi:hypothetical protein